MLKKMFTPVRFTAIFNFVLILGLSVAWAVEYYSGSRVYRLGHRADYFVIKSGHDRVRARVRANALDGYLTEQGLNKVKITGDMTEELVECDDGTTRYHLNFTFGPTGAYFEENKPLKLRIRGKYVETGCHVWLYDENGEELEGTRNDAEDLIIFDIPHFSTYSYDDYDY